MIQIKERVFHDFFETPFEIYSDSVPYVSVFKDDLKRFLSTKNPLFKSEDDYTYFTIYKNEKLVGRVCAHVHHLSNERHQIKRGYFGYLEVVDDQEVFDTLMKKAESWLKSRGCDEIAGNFNLTAMQTLGVVTDGFDRMPYTDQVYSPNYLYRLLEKSGYTSFFPMTSFEINLEETQVENYLDPKHQVLLEDSSYTWKTLDRSSVKKMFPVMCDLLNDGFDQNPMFVPLRVEEFEFQAKDLSLILDPKITCIAYHENDPVGVFITVPDIHPLLKETKSRVTWKTPYLFFKHKFKKENAAVIFMSVRRKYHSRGVGAVLVYQVIKSLKENGYKKLGISWVSDENIASLKNVERTKANKVHRLHLYRKNLE